MAKVFKAADNRGGRVRSLFTDSTVQGSSRSRVGTTPNRGAVFPSGRNVQEHGKTTDQPKDEAKEGTGFWLLNVSGGRGSAACSLPTHLEGQERQRGQCMQMGGRETCPKLEGNNT